MKKYDVIVAGSGPSGMAAAVSAARLGACVLLIEAQGSVGGIATTGMMSHFTGTCNSRVYREILKRASEKNLFSEPGAASPVIDPELLKNTFYEMITEADIDLLLYSLCCDVVMEGERVAGVTVQNKSGRSTYYADVIIDCTGDGDVACHAGARYFKGREGDGRMQPVTVMFKVGGVDETRAVFPGSFESLIDTPKGELQALAKAKLPHPAGHVLLYRSTLPGVVTVNMTNCTDIDGTSAEELTRAELVCRSQIEPIVSFLRAYAPGYENCYLLGAASLIGVRETRHFCGMYQMTEADIWEARQFEDAVVYGAYFNFDVHNLTGSGLDESGVQRHFTQQEGYTIPYGCLVPERIDGLLLSGRNISGTHMAHSNFRAMPICVGIGEACGVAAALAVKKRCRLRDIPASEIQAFVKS